jgi:hypothetical protein
LEISSGGNVSSNSAVIGDLSNGVGFATVTATWNTVGSLTVAEGGFGALTIDTTFGNVSSADAFVGRQAGSVGGVNVQAGIWTINEKLSIGGDADAGTTGGLGTVTVAGGTVSVGHDITIFSGDEVRLEAGTLDAPIITVQSGGLFDFTGGELFVDTFQGSLSNNGGTLAAREGSNSILVSGEYAQTADGTLAIEIAGDAASGQFDSMIVGNTAFLGGVLQVELADGFLPDPSETYAILDALNIGAGSFSNVANGERMFLNFSGGSFVVNYGAGSPFDPSQVVLSNFLRVADADFDDDGDVDGEDLEIWQTAYGATDLGDADGDADSDGRDFLIWQREFGAAPLSAFTASVAVPEPPSIGLGLLASLCLLRFNLARKR